VRRWLSPGHTAVLLVVTFLVISGVFLGRDTLGESFEALTSLNWGWILVAIGCEVISLVAFGLSRRRLLRADGHRAGFGSVMAVTYASNALSMTIPFAGVQLALVFSYRQFRRRGLGSAITGWALAVSAILSTAALALMLIVGAIAGGVSVATALGLAGAAIFLVPSTAVLLALRYQQIRGTLDRVLARIISGSRRLFHWPSDGATRALEDMLNRVARIRLPWPRYAEVFALCLLNWAADCGCLAATIRATGSQVPGHGILLVYAAGAAVGSAGLTPGGFALVEATLTAALVASGLTAPAALASVLAYRLVSFWMIMISGWVLMVALTRARAGRVRRYNYAGGPAGPRSAPAAAPVATAPALVATAPALVATAPAPSPYRPLSPPPGGHDPWRQDSR
jgi:putative heme transporter